MTRTYLLPTEKENPFAGKDRFMKDKHKRYVRLDTDDSGTMGYWDKKFVPMYALTVQQSGASVTCHLRRQEEKNGKARHPHDFLFSFFVGLMAALVMYLLLGMVIGLHPMIAGLVAVIAGLVAGFGLLVIYLVEYRGFYRLLDDYLFRIARARPSKGKAK